MRVTYVNLGWTGRNGEEERGREGHVMEGGEIEGREFKV